MTENDQSIPIQWPHASVAEAYGEGEYSTNVTEPWTQQLIVRLMWSIRSRTVLELGCHTGITSAWLAASLDQAGGGTAYFVDVNEDYCEQTRERLAALDLSDVETEVICADSVAAIHDLPPSSIDFAFIDDLADGRHIKPRLEALWSWYDPDATQRMDLGGIIAVHDTTKPDVASAVIGHQGYCLELPLMHSEGGLGIIQTPIE